MCAGPEATGLHAAGHGEAASSLGLREKESQSKLERFELPRCTVVWVASFAEQNFHARFQTQWRYLLLM